MERDSREVVTRELSEHKRFQGRLYLDVSINSMPSSSDSDGTVHVSHSAATEAYFLEITNFDSKSGRAEAQITYRNSLPPIPDELKGFLRGGDPFPNIPETDPRRQPATLELEGKFKKGSLILTRVKDTPDTMDEIYTLSGALHRMTDHTIETLSLSRTRKKTHIAENSEQPRPYEGTREDWLQKR